MPGSDRAREASHCAGRLSRASPRAAWGFAAALLPALALAQPVGPVEEHGPWLLSCAGDRMTDRTECRLLHRNPAAPAIPGQAAMALEAVQRDGAVLPAVTARDLSLEGAGRGLMALTGSVQLRFPPNRLFELPCALEGRSVVCLPRAEDAARAAAEFPAAPRALVRLTGLLPDAAARVAEPVELPLSRTAEAIARLRARAPADAPPEPPAAGLSLRDLLGRLMRLLGE